MRHDSLKINDAVIGDFWSCCWDVRLRERIVVKRVSVSVRMK